eukprot:6481406-Amphidinium_carterae.2
MTPKLSKLSFHVAFVSAKLDPICSRSETVKLRLQEAYATLQGQGRRKQGGNSDPLHCPGPVEASMLKLNRDLSIIERQQALPTSATAREVARLREYYSDALFVFAEEENVVCYKLLLAVCKPFGLSWLRVTHLDARRVVLGTAAEVWEGSKHPSPSHIWTYEPIDIAQHDPWSLSSPCECYVYMSTTYIGDRLIMSFSEVDVFERVHSSLLVHIPPSKTRVKENKKQAASGESESEGMHVSTDLPDDVSSKHAQSLFEDESAENESDAEQHKTGPSHVTEEAWHKVYGTIEEERQTRVATTRDISAWFTFTLTGGSWQIERTGRTTYGPRIIARRGSDASKFLTTFGSVSGV